MPMIVVHVGYVKMCFNFFVLCTRRCTVYCRSSLCETIIFFYTIHWPQQNVDGKPVMGSHPILCATKAEVI